MLATEISAAKRERDFYMSRVAKAKATTAQKERKLKVNCPFGHHCFIQHPCEVQVRPALQTPKRIACPAQVPAPDTGYKACGKDMIQILENSILLTAAAGLGRC